MNLDYNKVKFPLPYGIFATNTPGRLIIRGLYFTGKRLNCMGVGVINEVHVCIQVGMEPFVDVWSIHGSHMD